MFTYGDAQYVLAQISTNYQERAHLESGSLTGQGAHS
jgi:hypothetical protein